MRNTEGPLKVLMFGWEFPPHISGGLGTACYGLSMALLQEGVELIFVVPKLFGGEDASSVKLIDASKIKLKESYRTKESGRSKFSYIEVDSSLLPYVYPESRSIEYEKEYESKKQEILSNPRYAFSGHYGTNLLEEVDRYASIAGQIARDYDFDIIHAHDWLTYPAGIKAKEHSGKPLLIHVHATEFDRSGSSVNKLVFEIERKGMEAADRILTVSNFTRKNVIEKYGIDAAKVITVYNGIDPREEPNEIEKTIPEKIVTFLGRITFQKGPEYFVEAANKVLKKLPGVRFVMAGNGDMMNRMIQRAAELRISSRFHFTGFLDREEVDRLMAMSDVFVMPSVSEPFGLVPLEAIQANVPVIISKQSGISEILENAIKVDFWDIDELANSIYSLLKYPALSDHFKKGGKTEITQMTWGKAAKKVKEQYQTI
jgi:glycogen(starch) synthase